MKIGVLPEKICKGLDQGITTMKRLETALFSLASNPEKAFEVELISWNRVVDICKDGGIIKKIVYPGQRDQKPGDLDEVKGCFPVFSACGAFATSTVAGFHDYLLHFPVKYEARLVDGTVIARSPEEGIDFHVKEGRT